MYFCKKCSKTFEIFKPIKEYSSIEACDDCGEDGERSMGNEETNFVLNGKGWAKDGYEK